MISGCTVSTFLHCVTVVCKDKESVLVCRCDVRGTGESQERSGERSVSEHYFVTKKKFSLIQHLRGPLSKNSISVKALMFY